MALGSFSTPANGSNFSNGGYNNMGLKPNEAPTTYSGYKFSTPNSVIDPTMLQFSFWKGLLKFQLSPKVETQTGKISYATREGSVSIHLSLSRAQILKAEIEEYLNNPGKYANCGVATNKGYIYISNGEEFGQPGHDCLVIKLTDEETGKVVSTMAYEFKKQYHSGIRNLNEEKRSYDEIKDPYDNLEIYQILRVLDEYLGGSVGAHAASIRDATQYETAATQGSLKGLMQKFGLTLDKNNPMKTGPREAFFNANNNSTTVDSKPTSTTYDSYSDLGLD